MKNWLESRTDILEVISRFESEMKQLTNVPLQIDVSVDTLSLPKRQMLRVIAEATNVDYEVFAGTCRKWEFVRVRQIACVMLRMWFPTMPLKEIAFLVGLECHTTAMRSIEVVQTMLEVENTEYVRDYHSASKAIIQFLENGKA